MAVPRLLAIFLLLLWPALVLAGTTLAIPDLSDETGDPRLKGAGAGVASILVSRFSKVEGVQVVERAKLQAVIGELDLGASGRVDPATAAKAGQLVGADHLVLGSLTAIALPQLSISLRVVSTATGEVVLAEEVRGDVGASGEQFFVLVDEVAFKLTEALALKLTAKDRIALSQVEVQALNTVGVYGLALQALDAGRDQEAERLLSEALALEPGFRLAQTGLDQVRAEVAAARSDLRHDAVARGEEALARLERFVASSASNEPSLTEVCRRGLAARLQLLRGALPEAIAAEEARAAWITEHIGLLRTDPRSDPECGRFVREALSAQNADNIRYAVGDVPFWPFEIRAFLADLRFRLGQREAGISLLISNYQQPGPVGTFARWPSEPIRTLERWGAWDLVVVYERQKLEMARRDGREREIAQQLKEVESALSKAERTRKNLGEWKALQSELRGGSASVSLVAREARAVKAIREQLDLVHSGYAAYLSRVKAGFYRSALATDPSAFRELAEAWMEAADHLWQPHRWAAAQHVQHLLNYQAQVPAKTEEERARYTTRLSDRVTGAWR